jgi:hypothetical protein
VREQHVSGAMIQKWNEVAATKPSIHWWARQDSNLQPDRYERGISTKFVDFAAFLFDFDRVCCVSFRPFLVRNWCGV